MGTDSSVTQFSASNYGNVKNTGAVVIFNSDDAEPEIVEHYAPSLVHSFSRVVCVDLWMTFALQAEQLQLEMDCQEMVNRLESNIFNREAPLSPSPLFDLDYTASNSFLYNENYDLTSNN